MSILEKLEEYNLDRFDIQMDLQGNRQNNSTAAYYLLLKKYQKMVDHEIEENTSESVSQMSCYTMSPRRMDFSQTFSFSPHPPLPRTGFEITISPRHKRFIDTTISQISMRKKSVAIKDSPIRNMRHNSLLPNVNIRSPVSRFSDSPPGKNTRKSLTITPKLAGNDRFANAAARAMKSRKLSVDTEEETIGIVESSFKIRSRLGTAMVVKGLAKRL